ncbi:MAG: hypothetical protein JWO73_550 [Candidatus Taylorbacteria bacterium]|nr:hypothetical protein [Candidatus Taylorbacteria bacterium]
MPYTIKGNISFIGASGIGGNFNIDDGATVTFYESSHNDGNISGPGGSTVFFYDSSENNGNISGGVDVVFNGSSLNKATGNLDVSTAVFNGSSINAGAVLGQTTFNGSSYNSTGQVYGGSDVRFNTDHYGGVAPTGGTITLSGSQSWTIGAPEGIIRDSDGNQITTFVFNNQSTVVNTLITGDAIFNGQSRPEGSHITGNATFNSSYFSQTPPMGGVLEFNGTNWSNRVDGTMFDSQSNPITLFLFGPNSFNDSAGFIFADASFNDSNNLGTISGAYTATFNGTSSNSGAEDYVHSIFNGDSYNTGAISGDAEFHDRAHSDTGSISGTALFDGESYCQGTEIFSFATFNGTGFSSCYIDGGAEFNDTTRNDGTVLTAATFNASSTNNFEIYADTTFNGRSFNGSSGNILGAVTFNNLTYNLGGTFGTTTFNGISYNGGNTEVGFNAIFNDTTHNEGTVLSDATFNTNYYASTTPAAGRLAIEGGKSWIGYLGGAVYGSDNDPITSFIFYGTSTNAGDVNVPAIFNGSSTNGATLHSDATFNDHSSNGADVEGTSTFNGFSFNSGTISISTFNGSSHNEGSIFNNATFNDLSYNNNDIDGNAVFNGTSHNSGNGHVFHSATFNTDWYGGSVPAAGIFNIDGGKSWLGEVFGTVFGSDNATTTGFFLNGTSTNQGVIFTTYPLHATTTLNGDLPANNGTINGTKVRRYASNATTTANFLTGAPWTVFADGAVVDVSGATFGTSTTFLALNGGSFATLSTACGSPLIGGLTYRLSANATATCTVSGNNVTLDGDGKTLVGNIIGNGATSGAAGFSFNLVSITVTGSITSNGANGTIGGAAGTITVSSSTVASITSTGGNGTGNGGAGGTITVISSTSTALAANGGNSSNNGAGGNGGTINVIDSAYTTLSTVAGVDGPNKNPAQGSGSGGSSHVTDRVPPVITLNGSASVSVAEGGTYTELGATAVDAVSGSRTVVVSGSVNAATPGIYIITYTAADAAGNTAAKTRAVTVVAAVRGCMDSTAANYNSSATISNGSCTYASATTDSPGSGTGAKSGYSGLSRGLAFGPVNPLSFNPLPNFSGSLSANQGVTNFGNILSGLNSPRTLKLSPISFRFVPQVSSFLFAPLPPSVVAILNKLPKVSSQLASAGLNHEQDLVSLLRNPIPLTLAAGEAKPAGLFFVSASSTPLRAFISGDTAHPLIELVRATSGDILDVSLIPLSKAPISAKFEGKSLAFFISKTGEAHALISVPARPGRYFLTTAAAPMPLVIEVREAAKPVFVPKPTLGQKVSAWFSRIFR